MDSSLVNGIFNEINGFERTLAENGERKIQLFKYFQGLIDAGFNVCALLSSYFCTEIHLLNIQQSEASKNILKLGLELSKFFIDGYWFEDSKRVLLSCLSLPSKSDKLIDPFAFDCSVKLLQVYNSLHELEKSERLVNKLQEIISTQKLEYKKYNVSDAYLQFSKYYFICSGKLAKAYKWCEKALINLDDTNFLLIDILCHFSRICIEKKEMAKANEFIKEALSEAKNMFSFDESKLSFDDSLIQPKVVELLLNYGFYLESSGQAGKANTVYECSSKLASKIFSDKCETKTSNLLVKIAHQEFTKFCSIEDISNERNSTDHPRQNIENFSSKLQTSNDVDVSKTLQKKLNSWKQKCLAVINNSFRCSYSKPFRFPMDTISFPKYLHVVKNPIDLTTIKTRLNGFYKEPHEFRSDINLIVRNSRLFYGKDSLTHQKACRMKALFNTKMKPVFKQYKVTKRKLSKNMYGKRNKRKAELLNDDDIQTIEYEDENHKNDSTSLKPKKVKQQESIPCVSICSDPVAEELNLNDLNTNTVPKKNFHSKISNLSAKHWTSDKRIITSERDNKLLIKKTLLRKTETFEITTSSNHLKNSVDGNSDLIDHSHS
ncbi:amyloid protein-binding protein 2-like protein [Dinothrombium tinctorium]|uniref:Amyloid protein-binding protein 2-like protein n=1 Tax=Dinothrombium tinctorium TaxID=1965070 RepID=A0A3S3P3K7_9ACAR|nr:amyloid protein-binding protein 2-like protein [Dinothrombium tinctorium]